MKTARYLRLADVIHGAITDGKLAPGEKLPTHRAFARKFGVALATATRVYGELERRGVVVGETGRGTFVRDPGVPPELGMRQGAGSEATDLIFNMPGSAEDPEMLRAGLRRMAGSGDLEAMLRYQPHGGRPHERRIIAGYAARTLGTVDPECLLVTSGAQHGLAAACLGLLAHGDAVAADALTYPGFKSVAALQGLELVPVRAAGGVMDPEDLEAQCRRRRIRAAYVMPTVQNPLGGVMDTPSRQRLVEAARAHDLLLIEDAAYAFLEPDAPPSLLQLAPERTVHVSGFSKSLATGFRLGYLIAPPDRVDPLLEAIRATTWSAPALVSNLVTGWIADGTLERSEDRRRQDGAMRHDICREVLEGLPVLSHRNGGFAWLQLAAGQRAEPVVLRLKEQGITTCGAEPFATTAAAPQALRLAFGGLPSDELRAALLKVRAAVEQAAPE